MGHCRLNLAVLYSANWAERFRLAYEAETGMTARVEELLESVLCRLGA